MGDAAGSFLRSRSSPRPTPSSRCSGARRRSRPPRPRRPRTTSAGGDDRAPAVRPVDVRVLVRNGSGVKGAAGNTSQQLQQQGFVGGGVQDDPRGLVDHSEIRYAAADMAKAQARAGFVPGRAARRGLHAGRHRYRAGPREGLPRAGHHGHHRRPQATTTTMSPEAACVWRREERSTCRGPPANGESATGSAVEESTRWRGFWGRVVIAVVVSSVFMGRRGRAGRPRHHRERWVRSTRDRRAHSSRRHRPVVPTTSSSAPTAASSSTTPATPTTPCSSVTPTATRAWRGSAPTR